MVFSVSSVLSVFSVVQSLLSSVQLFEGFEFFAGSGEDFFLDFEFFAGDQVHAVEGGFEDGAKLGFQISPDGFQLGWYGGSEAAGDFVDGLKVGAHGGGDGPGLALKFEHLL